MEYRYRQYFFKVTLTTLGIGTIFRASQQPKEFQLYLGNLYINATNEGIREFLQDNNIAIRLISCDIVKSSRTSNLRAVAASVVIDHRDKDTAFEVDSWPEDVIICPWKQPLRQQNQQYRDTWDIQVIFFVMVSIVTFNLHGHGNGLNMLQDLCSSCDLVCAQEHWIRQYELGVLQSLTKSHRAVVFSAMTEYRHI